MYRSHALPRLKVWIISRWVQNWEKSNIFSVFQPSASQWGWSGSTRRASVLSTRGGCRCTRSRHAPASSSIMPLWRTPASIAARPPTPAATLRRHRWCWRSTVSPTVPHPYSNCNWNLAVFHKENCCCFYHRRIYVTKNQQNQLKTNDIHLM